MTLYKRRHVALPPPLLRSPGRLQFRVFRFGLMMADELFWIVLLTLTFVSAFSTSEPPSAKEYCEREVFEAGCSTGEVILVHSAVYGRMRLGRCVRQEYESVGCKVNVLGAVDSKCSGRRECRFHTSELHRYSTCENDLVAYLEASYECIPVRTCEADVCNAGNLFRVTLSSGFLASSDPAIGRCGSPTCPWVFAPQRGQRFNLTFYSFLVPEQPEKYCHRLASVADKAAKFSKDVTICSGQEGRTLTHVTPESVVVEVVMYTPSTTTISGSENEEFSLLRYEAIGCPDRAAPYGGWANRKGDLLTVGCDRVRRTWHLTCDGTNWIGEAGTCSEDPVHNGVTEQESWDIGVALQQASSTTHGLLLIVGIGVVLGILLGFSMLTVAVVLIKRRRRLARIELRQACMAQLSKSEEADSNPNNLYNQSILSGGGGYGTSEKLSLAADSAYAAYHLRSGGGGGGGGVDQPVRQSSRHTSSIRIVGSCGRGSSPPRSFPPPPPPPPPGQTLVVDDCVDSECT